MHAPLAHPSVTPPQPRQRSTDVDGEASTASDPQPMRSQGPVGDVGGIVQRPVPDWDWDRGPDDERRRN